MNNKCLICKNRDNCLTYQLGGLIGTWCDKFVEERDITDEEQEHRDAQELNKKSAVEKLIDKFKRS